MLRTNNQQMDNEVIYLSDEEFKKTYVADHPGECEYKTNLLGLDSGCDKKFKIIPVIGPLIDSDGIIASKITQNNEANCAYITVLRAISRRNFFSILNILKYSDYTVKVKLFLSYGEKKQTVTYQIDRTIVMPDNTSIYNTVSNFFASEQSNSVVKMPWIKIIEKALVLHTMRSDYPINLMNIQHHGRDEDDLAKFLLQGQQSKGVIPSYGDVVTAMGENKLFSTLIGCETRDIYNYQIKELIQEIRAELSKGEILTVGFSKNKYGFENNHGYEIVNFAKVNNNEYLILSNPWGTNSNKGALNLRSIDESSIEFLSDLTSFNQITKDESMIAISLEQFYEITTKCTLTKGAPQLLDYTPKIGKQEKEENTHSKCSLM